MIDSVPMGANELIEQQLDERLKGLEQTLKCDILTFVGDIIDGVDDVVRNIIEQKRKNSKNQKKLTVFLTTPGGYIGVVQRIVDILRHHYRIVDFFIPNYAFSAGTVFAMSGDAIYMDYYSRLGPIDPQLERPDGKMVPAVGYLIQWERLLEKARNGSITLPEVQLMLEGFDQAELYQYEQARELSISLLEEWLVKYKFKNWKKTETRLMQVTEEMKKQRASEIGTILNDTDRWHVHGYGISMGVLKKDLNLVIDDFGSNLKLCDKIKQYHTLLDDYMIKMSQKGILHTAGIYRPFLDMHVHGE